MFWLRVGFISLYCLLLGSMSFAEDFPYREKYPDVPVIELEELKAGYDDGSVVIVDVRSSIEYETIHPKGALHITLANADFEKNLADVADKNLGKRLALYCNGITCLKSYNGTQKAIDAGIKNVFAFDAGIPAWANAYPSETLLIGKAIINPEKQLIPKSEFAKKTVDFKTFSELVKDPDAKVIDARDPMQRMGNIAGLERALPIPLNKLIRNIINHERWKDKKLVIFDQVGKQVRWVMYHLEDKGYTDYYFLEGGATAVLKEQKYWKANAQK